jgi:hypothetical protein
MSTNTKPSVIIVAPATTTLEEVSSITISGTPSIGTTTEYTSTFITTTISATTTTTPDGGVFISETTETLIIVIIAILSLVIVALALQFKRVRGQKDRRENIDQLEKVIKPLDE